MGGLALINRDRHEQGEKFFIPRRFHAAEVVFFMLLTKCLHEFIFSLFSSEDSNE